MNKKQIAITLGTVCLVLVMAIIVQMKTITNANNVAGQSLSDNSLRDQVLRWKERYDSAYASLQDAEKTLENVRKKSTENNDDSKTKEEKLKNNNMMIGLTDVQGQGVIVTVKDDNTATASSISSTDDISLHLVHEQDIRDIINELENTGAEAISVNDQRIIATTTINCEGTVININGEKVASPFIIKAIGDSFIMNSSLTRPGGTVEKFNSTGIITTVKTSNNITIPKYSGVLNTKYLKYSE